MSAQFAFGNTLTCDLKGHSWNNEHLWASCSHSRGRRQLSSQKEKQKGLFCTASCWTRRAENDFGCAQWHTVRKKPLSTKPHTSQARWRIRGFDSSSPFVHPDCPSPLMLILYPWWIQQTLQGKKKMTKKKVLLQTLSCIFCYSTKAHNLQKNHLLSLQRKLTNRWLREKATLAFYSHNVFQNYISTCSSLNIEYRLSQGRNLAFCNCHQ